MSDIRCRDLAEIFATKKPHYKHSDQYINEVHDSPDKSGSNEQEHMVGWFSYNEIKGEGAYSRQKPNYSAKRCYNLLQNAASLLWIAESVGVDDKIVAQAFEAAKEVGDRRRACGAIRKIIPWSMIFECLNISESKVYDPKGVCQKRKLAKGKIKADTQQIKKSSSAPSPRPLKRQGRKSKNTCSEIQDIRCRDLAEIFLTKKRFYPITKKYYKEVCGYPFYLSARSERKHMVGWFNWNETKGEGAYSRQKPNYSAKRCYNLLQNGASLIWIAEAVGVDRKVVIEAFEAAQAAGDHRRACGAIRKVIPWSTIYECLNVPKELQFDAKAFEEERLKSRFLNETDSEVEDEDMEYGSIGEAFMRFIKQIY